MQKINRLDIKRQSSSFDGTKKRKKYSYNEEIKNQLKIHQYSNDNQSSVL